MAQRTTDELKVFLEGTLKQYNDLADKTGTVFFDKANHAVYAKGECIIKSNVASVELVAPTGSTEKTIIKLTYFDGKSEQIDTAIPDEFVRFKVSQTLTPEQQETARTNIGAEAADATILKEEDVVNNLTTNNAKAPLSAAQGQALKGLVDGKVDQVDGKGLSTEDFTTALKEKLDGLKNYDDTALTEAINSLQEQLDTLVNADADKAIDTFNEIIAFLNGVENTDTLEGIIAGIEQQISDINESINGIQNASKVESINELSGKVKVKGEQALIDDTDGDGSGEITCTPINVSTSTTAKEISLGINREGALGILAMALQKAANTSSDGWVRFDNIDVHFTPTSGDNDAHITMSSTPKVWKFED